MQRRISASAETGSTERSSKNIRNDFQQIRQRYLKQVLELPVYIYVYLDSNSVSLIFGTNLSRLHLFKVKSIPCLNNQL